jgi:hypothetical protein
MTTPACREARPNVKLALGVTSASGLVVAARGVLGVFNGWGFDANTIAVGNELNGSASALLVAGALIDWYALPEHGCHAYFSPGYAVTHLRDSDSRLPGNPLRGFAFAAGIGYEGWVSEQWSIGLQGRVDLAWLETDGAKYPSEALNLVAPGLQASFSYN